MKPLFVVLFMLLSLPAGIVSAEEKRWVSGDGAVLKKEASITSEDLTPLPIGMELVLIEPGGRWLKVKTATGAEGWVYAGKLTETPPAAEVAGDGGLFGDVLQKSTIETAKADSARSIRGLSPETTQYAKQRGTPQAFRKELDKILARKVTPKELQSFLREGKIGEYAE